MTIRRKRIDALAVRSRRCLTRRLARVRILRKVLVRDHSWLRRRRWILGVLFIPILSRDLAERLPIYSRVHQERDGKSLQQYSLYNCALHNPPVRHLLGAKCPFDGSSIGSG